MIQSSGRRLPSLDGLRAIACAMVVCCHLVQTAIEPGTTWWRDVIVALGPLGVRVFFVISGFLITHLLLEEFDRNGTIDLKRFLVRRTLRIFVPYLSFLAVVALLVSAGHIQLSGRDFVHAVTYTTNYYPSRLWPVAHAWSLSVEEQFYLLWPVLIVLARRAASRAAVAVLLICPLVRLFYYWSAPDLIEEEVGYRFETVADALATGCVLAASFGWVGRSAVPLRFLRSPAFLLVPLVVLAAAQAKQDTLHAMLFGVSVQNLGIAAIVAYCVLQPSSLAGSILNLPAVTFFGGMSYSLYLWQQIFLNPTTNWGLAQFPVNIVLACLTAIAAHFLIERPSHRLRERLSAPSVASRLPRSGTLPGSLVSP